MRRSTPIALPAWKPVSLHGSGSARASRRQRGANAGAAGRHRRVTLQRRASGTEWLSLSDTAFRQPRRYWGGKRDQRNSYRRRYDQPCRNTFDTRRIRRLNCRLPTRVRTDPSVFDSKCIRVDDGCVSMSDKGTPVESAFRLGFCAWAKAQAAYPRQREPTRAHLHNAPTIMPSWRSPLSAPIRGTATVHRIRAPSHEGRARRLNPPLVRAAAARRAREREGPAEYTRDWQNVC